MILRSTINHWLVKYGWEVRRVSTHRETSDNSVIVDTSKPNLCICSPEKNVASETFIRAHVDLIDANVFYLHGWAPPRFTSTDQSLLDWGPTIQEGLQNYLVHNQIDVVLAEYGTMGANIYPICRAAGVPLITHFHGFDASRRRTIEEFLPRYREMFDYSSYVVGVSKEMLDRLSQMGCPENKLVYNPCGPADSFFDISPAYESNQFLAVGRLVDKKAPYLTLAAFREVHELNKDARLVFAGDGELMDCCRNLARYWKLENEVEFLGAVDHGRVRELLQSSFCYLQHSITASDGNTEGTPVGILEASAAGLAVVSTRHAGIKDVIVEAETGFLVDEQDVHAMAQAMIRLLQQNDLAKEFGRKGREWVRTHFSMNRHIGVLNELVQHCAHPGTSRNLYGVGGM